MVNRLSGFDCQGAMEKRCGEGHLGRADDAFLGIKHEPSKPGLESGWEIDKQIQAMALLIKGRMIDQIGHFGVSCGLKFKSYVERVALAGGLGSRVNAIPSQGSQGGFTAKVYTERGNVGHSKRGGGRGRRPTVCCGSRTIQQGAW